MSLIQLHYLLWLYHTPIKANIILGFMALFALHYQYVEIIVCWEIKLHYCVSFSCLINNDGWLLFSSPPATILSSSPLQVKNERINKEIKGERRRTSSDTKPEVLVSLKFQCLIKAEKLQIWAGSTPWKSTCHCLFIDTSFGTLRWRLTRKKPRRGFDVFHQMLFF